MMRKLGIPLPTSALGDLEPDVLWETFKASLPNARLEHRGSQLMLQRGQAGPGTLEDIMVSSV